MIKSFEDLEIWQLSIKLAKDVYKLTESFPQTEKYGMSDQIKRAVVSVSTNIAEGFGRFHYKDKKNFLYNARGSLMEVKSLLYLATQLFALPQTHFLDINKQIINVSVKLNNFIQATGEKTVK